MATRVLTPVHNGTWFIELERVARLCKRTKRYEPVLLDGNAGARMLVLFDRIVARATP